MSDKIRETLAGMLAIVDDSRGVEGYHLNGAIAEWDEFPEVEAARAALAQQPAPAAPVALGIGQSKWKVLRASGSALRPSDRWEVYAPDGSGGVVQADEISNTDVARLLDALSAAPPAAEQPGTVAVPRELLERLAGSPDLDPDCCMAYYRQQLRAMLDKEGEA